MRFSVLATLLLMEAQALAATYQLSYGGRLAQAGGAPEVGPVNLQVRFFRNPSGGSELVAPVSLSNVTLTQGYFQITIPLPDTAMNTIFPAVTTDAYIEITDVTHSRTFPRQRFSGSPYAFKVPVDGTTIAFNANGVLAVQTPISVANGGTGATSAADARTALGLGSLATQAAAAVSISGGTISGVTTLSATGSVGIGATASACAAGNSGHVRFNATSLKLEYCTGSAWVALGTESKEGTFAHYSEPTPPAGWLLCNGQAVSRATYSKLFALWGTRYGVGNGSTTFNVPNLQGYVLAMQDGSNAANTMTTSNSVAVPLPYHSHTASTAAAGSHTHTVSVGSGGNHSHYFNKRDSVTGFGVQGAAAGNTGGSVSTQNTSADGDHNHGASASVVGDHAHVTTVDYSGTNGVTMDVRQKTFYTHIIVSTGGQ